MVTLENDLEKAKQSLSLKADFNLIDAFKIFDKYNLGELYRQDLENGLERLHVYFQRKDVDLFLKRYDLNHDNKLRFHEFTEALLTKDKLYADHLSHKKSNYLARRPEDAFTTLTRYELADTLKTMIRCEGYAEELRQNLSKRTYFTISGAF